MLLLLTEQITKKKNKNKNELLSFQQKRNLAKSERKIF